MSGSDSSSADWQWDTTVSDEKKKEDDTRPVRRDEFTRLQLIIDEFRAKLEVVVARSVEVGAESRSTLNMVIEFEREMAERMDAIEKRLDKIDGGIKSDSG